MWHNEERGRRYKKIWHTEESRYRVSMTHAAIHRESVLDSGAFDDEIDVAIEDYHGSKLGGIRAKRAGYASGYQSRPSSQGQKALGTFGFGGRRGEDYINIRPSALGYMNRGKFHAIVDKPQFNKADQIVMPKKMGFEDGVIWTINAASEIDVGPIWSLGGGDVSYKIRMAGGQSEPIITIDERARNHIWNIGARTSAAQTDFGVLFHLDWNGIDRIIADKKQVSRTGNMSWKNELRAFDRSNKLLAAIGQGMVYVPGRAGRATAIKRAWFDGTDWWLFVGAKVSEINDFLPGDLIIDPPISEESIIANADDAGQTGATTMGLSGQFSNQIFLGHYSTLYHGGWRFQSVPIGQGETVNSATLEPLQESASATVNVDIDLFGDDVDNAAAFTTTNGDITGRTRTTATTNVLAADIPGNTNRASWDVASIVQEIIDRPGWNEQALAFVGIAVNTNTDYVGFTDYNGSAANAADFNADVTVTGGGGAASRKIMLLGVT